MTLRPSATRLLTAIQILLSDNDVKLTRGQGLAVNTRLCNGGKECGGVDTPERGSSVSVARDGRSPLLSPAGRSSGKLLHHTSV